MEPDTVPENDPVPNEDEVEPSDIPDTDATDEKDEDEA